MKILWIDDEPHMNHGAIDIFAQYGHEVKTCKTVLDGVKEYNRTFYDCIILDRNVPRGEILWSEEAIGDDDEDTGEAIFNDLRSRYHLIDTPIVFFTQYNTDAFQESIMGRDERVRVVSKDQFGDVLIGVVEELCRKFPSEEFASPDIKLTDHFAVVPYFVTDVQTKRRERIVFKAAVGLSGDLAKENFRMGGFFVEKSKSSANSIEVVFCERKNLFSKPLGVLHTGHEGEGINWRKNIMFETAWTSCHDNPDRRFKGVGKALLARLLRECMREERHLEKDIVIDEEKYAAIGATFHPPLTVRPFLRHLGCELVGRFEIRVPYQVAVGLLAEVSRGNDQA